MKIDNSTHWRTDDLRKIITAAVIEEGLDPSDRWLFSIVYTRPGANRDGRYVTGWAYCNSRRVHLRVPRDHDVPVKEFAQVAVHEIGHCKGLGHEDMVRTRSIAVPWVEGMVIRKRAERAKPAVDKRAQAHAKVERAEELIALEEKRHGTAMKRLRTKLANAKKSAAYYDRKAEMGIEDKPRQPRGKSPVPTVAAVKRKLREDGEVGIDSIDVGFRPVPGDPDTITSNRLAYGHEAELHDIRPLSDALAEIRQAGAPAWELDLYLYTRDGLAGNSTLDFDGASWSIG